MSEKQPIPTLLFRTSAETGLTLLFSAEVPFGHFDGLQTTPREAQSEPGPWHSPPAKETHILCIDEGTIVFGVRDQEGKVHEFRVGPGEEYRCAAFEDWASEHQFCGHRSQAPAAAKFRKCIRKNGFDSIPGQRVLNPVELR